MNPTLRSHRYGKQRVRLTHLDRSSEPHRLVIVAVDIALEGDFAASYTDGDNRKVVATDSMKNTVYVLAREQGVRSIEALGVALARQFVGEYPAVDAARIELEEEIWSPIRLAAGAAPDAFERTASELGTASVAFDGDELAVRSGIARLQVLKSAHSGFSDFHRDRSTTLADSDDRLFATSVSARWRLDAGAPPDFDPRARREEVRRILVETFASHHSAAVQQTLYAMGAAVLEQLDAIAEITLALPNQHHLLVDLSPFGLDNPNRVFASTDQPFGQIEATLGR